VLLGGEGGVAYRRRPRDMFAFSEQHVRRLAPHGGRSRAVVRAAPRRVDHLNNALGRVRGISAARAQTTPDGQIIALHVVAGWGRDVRDIEREIRAVARALLGALPPAVEIRIVRLNGHDRAFARASLI